MEKQPGSCTGLGMRGWELHPRYPRMRFSHCLMTLGYTPVPPRCLKCFTVRGSATPGKPTTTSLSGNFVSSLPSWENIMQTTRKIQMLGSVFLFRCRKYQRREKRVSWELKIPPLLHMTYSLAAPATPPPGGRMLRYPTSKVKASRSITHNKQTGNPRW